MQVGRIRILCLLQEVPQLKFGREPLWQAKTDDLADVVVACITSITGCIMVLLVIRIRIAGAEVGDSTERVRCKDADLAGARYRIAG